MLLLHLEEPAISIQPAVLTYPSAFSFSLFSPSGKQFVAQVSFLLEKIVLTRVLCAALGCSPKLVKKNKNSKSWMYVYKPIPSQTRIQIIKDHPHQYT